MDGELKAFASKNILAKEIGCDSPEVFNIMAQWPEKFAIVDFYLAMADKYIIKGYVKNDLQLVDVGKLDSLQQAEHMYLQLKNN